MHDDDHDPERDGHSHGHHHHHGHSHDHSELDEMELRVRALDSLLTEKGYIDPPALDALIETYEKNVGPRNGAAVVARQGVGPADAAGEGSDPARRDVGCGGHQGAAGAPRAGARTVLLRCARDFSLYFSGLCQASAGGGS